MHDARTRIAVIVAALLVSIWSTPADALPRGTRLTYHDDPSTTIAISWNSDDPTDDQVIWGTSPMMLSMTMTADEMHTQPAPLGTSFTKRLSGLLPNTTYYYRVGGPAGFHPAAGNPPFEFTTRSADICDPMRFILIGDNRADFDGIGASPLWNDIMLEAMAHTPDFFVNTGDMVKNGDDPGEWSNFIDESEEGWALVPSILTMGNHDEDAVAGDAALYNQLYELPRNAMIMTEDYYSIDIGPVHFVSLNTQFLSGTELTDMLAWLDADLAATTQPWKIVFFHKAVYSRGNHSSGEENGGIINSSFIPLFDLYDVDMVFNGHSHNYERYAPSTGVDMFFGGAGRSITPLMGGPVPDGLTGTTYLVSGGAGALTTDVFGYTCMDVACCFCVLCLPPPLFPCNAEVYGNDVAQNVEYDGRHGFVIFDLMGDMLTATAWSTNAGNISPASMVDSFSMVDTGWSSTCGMMGGTDAGVPGSDSGTMGGSDGGGGTDGGNIPGTDSGNIPGTDSGGGIIPGTDSGNGGGGAGGCTCGCRVVAAPDTSGDAAYAFAAFALLAGALRRRRRRVSRR